MLLQLCHMKTAQPGGTVRLKDALNGVSSMTGEPKYLVQVYRPKSYCDADTRCKLCERMPPYGLDSVWPINEPEGMRQEHSL